MTACKTPIPRQAWSVLVVSTLALTVCFMVWTMFGVIPWWRCSLDDGAPREHQILAHIAHGVSNKEIARALDIAETTVKIHAS